MVAEGELGYTTRGRRLVAWSAILGYAFDFYDLIILAFLLVQIQKSLNVSLPQTGLIVSMTLAASSAISPPVARSIPRPPPGPFGPVASEIMPPQRRRLVQALPALAWNHSCREDITRPCTAKVKMHFSPANTWKAVYIFLGYRESVPEERR